jgi:hypothetical protein
VWIRLPRIENDGCSLIEAERDVVRHDGRAFRFGVVSRCAGFSDTSAPVLSTTRRSLRRA